MRTLHVVTLLALLLLLACGAASATTGGRSFFVSPDGDDANPGTSAQSPWRTVAKVNSRSYAAGDSIFFQGGRTFSDAGLRFTPASRGTPGNPIIVGSYGSGRALINPPDSHHGVDVYNTAGIEIHDLIFEGSGISTSTRTGFHAYVDLPGNARLPHLQVVNSDFRGFYLGIAVGAWHASGSGFDDVLIERCLVHTIRRDGITTWGYWESSPNPVMSHRRITIRDCEVHGVTGDPGNRSDHSGSGIIVSGVRDALVDRCYAHHNGGSSGKTSGGGPVGIWTWHSDGVVIQRSLVHDQRTTPGVKDGGGFDIDGGARNAVIQYSYSYNNEGPGYLIAAFNNTAPLVDGTIRYNISWRDGRRVANSHGSGIHFWNGNNPTEYNSNVRIYNNTLYAEAGSGGPLIRYQSGRMSGHYIANNILVVRGGQRFINIPGALPAFTFHNNAYFAVDGNYSGGWRWGAATYTSLASWRAASGNPETFEGRPLGFQLDPRVNRIVNGAQPTSVAQMEAMTAFRLDDDSPLIDAGLDLGRSEHGALDVGSRDFFGNPIPAGDGFELGAHARAFAPPNPNLIVNGDFGDDAQPTQSPQGWSTWASNRAWHDADHTELSSDAVSGDFHLTHWRDASAWNVYTYQVVRNLPDGRYTLRAWGRRGGTGFVYSQLEVKEYANRGGTKLAVTIPEGTSYQELVISGIEVRGGSALVGFYSEVAGGDMAWAQFDHVSFTAE